MILTSPPTATTSLVHEGVSKPSESRCLQIASSPAEAIVDLSDGVRGRRVTASIDREVKGAFVVGAGVDGAALAQRGEEAAGDKEGEACQHLEVKDWVMKEKWWQEEKENSAWSGRSSIVQEKRRAK